MLQRLGFVAIAATFALIGGAGTAAARPDPAPPAGDRGAAEKRSFVVDIAHRGASGYAPENTLAAIDEAQARGATTVEIDVQRSKDGELVVMHDTTLDRTTDVEERFPGRAPYNVGDFTVQELKRLDAGSWFGSAYAGEQVPTLAQALDRLSEHGMNLALEIKAPARYPGIESAIAQELTEHPRWLAPAGGAGNRAPRLMIQSFDWASVQRSHRLLPHIPHGLLGTVPEDEIGDYADWADLINPNHTALDAGYVNRIHRAGLAVYTYTVNEPEDMRAVLDLGVDGIISDYPDTARRVIGEQNRRHP